MTEAGMITSNPLDGERIPGTVGYPLPGIAIRIVDDGGKTLPPGESGSIEIRGPNVFPGYWQLPEKTAEDFCDDGFFITGDLGYVSDDNRLSIAGREKDLIISGGYNIYPREIELLLDNMDGIQESAVIGAPHPDLGESVIAILVANGEKSPAEEKILKTLEDKLARFKQPRRCIYVDELPRNTMGKVQKNLLREQYKNIFDQKNKD
jgi:malonyl-CoA/methylmalonyl-CoA synthetase